MNRSAVIDCSALLPAFADEGTVGQAVRSRLKEIHTLAAPSLLDYEFVAALLGMVRGKKLTSEQMTSTMARFHDAKIRREHTIQLWQRVRDLNHDLTAYDAQYVALAEALDLPLITCDARIKRSGAAKCVVEVFG